MAVQERNHIYPVDTTMTKSSMAAAPKRAGAPEAEVIARAIYDAMLEGSRNGFFGIYRPGERVTIDGQFNLLRVARALQRRLAISSLSSHESRSERDS